MSIIIIIRHPADDARRVGGRDAGDVGRPEPEEPQVLIIIIIIIVSSSLIIIVTSSSSSSSRCSSQSPRARGATNVIST